VRPATALAVVKLVHTAAWALFAGCIVVLPVAAHLRRFDVALVLAALVLLETGLLACNRWSCPLTAVAARDTDDRSPNFDIHLPALLARYNKQVFATLFALGLAYTAWRWWSGS
jgi:hypothetical protein